MGYTDSGNRRARLSAAVAAGGIQAATIVALVAGLAANATRKERDTLAAVQLSQERPAPSSSIEQPIERAAERAAEPEGRTGSALPRDAPPAAVPMPVPAAAPTPQQGAAPATAPGTAGSGSGAGDAGSGSGGGGGGGVPARRIAGDLTDRDYPEAAARTRAAGVVAIQFRIAPDGSVGNCTVLRSSGHRMLDEITCRLVERRFRYAPARDASGRAVEVQVRTTFAWGPRD